jgi:hypothetical protein
MLRIAMILARSPQATADTSETFDLKSERIDRFISNRNESDRRTIDFGAISVLALN